MNLCDRQSVVQIEQVRKPSGADMTIDRFEIVAALLDGVFAGQAGEATDA
jgi:hypothetical protein